MKKFKIIIPLLILGLLVFCYIYFIYIPASEIDKLFAYEIDKEKGEVTITAYYGDEIAKEEYWEEYWELSAEEREKKRNKVDYIETLNVPDKIKGYPVTVIGNSAFTCSKFKEVNLPDTVVRIENGAFYGCENMEVITGTGNVEYLGLSAFAGCFILKSIDTSSVKYIGEWGFTNCDNIKELTIPKGVETISEDMCYGMDSLKMITIPESVKSIGSFSFSGCDNLRDAYIPESVTTINESAFNYTAEDFTIHAPKGSYAQEYAIQHGYNYEEWDGQ